MVKCNIKLVQSFDANIANKTNLNTINQQTNETSTLKTEINDNIIKGVCYYYECVIKPLNSVINLNIL